MISRYLFLCFFVAVIVFSVMPCEGLSVNGENLVTIDIPANWDAPGVWDFGTGYSEIVINAIDEFAVITSVNVTYRLYNAEELTDIWSAWLNKESIDFSLPVESSGNQAGIQVFNGINPAGTWRLYIRDWGTWWDGLGEVDSHSEIREFVIRVYYIIEEQPPGDPTDPDPDDSALDVSIYTGFQWGSAPRAATYDIRIWKQVDTEPVSPTGSGLTSPSYTPGSPLEPLILYFWEVTVHNSAGTEEGPTWSFGTDDGSPGAVLYESPGDGGQQVLLLPNITWTQGIGADTYDLYVWRSIDGVPGTATYPDIVGTQYSISTELESQTEYSWKVRSFNGYGDTESDTWTFTTRKSFDEWIADFYADPSDQMYDADPDSDGLLNGDEYDEWTLPDNEDTDGDGYKDGLEVDRGWSPINPYDPADYGSGTKGGGCLYTRSNSGLLFAIIALISAALALFVKRN